jgi:hypothetical protein
MAQYFTLDQARAALARIKPDIARALALRVEMREGERELQSISRKIMMSGGLNLDRDHVAGIKQRLDETVTQLREVVDEIQNRGALIKDLDTGLLDFPTLYRGQEVYLCWRAGEPDIGWWHAVEDGFRGRKPIDRHFIENHSAGEES